MNLYIVTLFWSAMVDVFEKAAAQRWFGTMAAAGSIGSVLGSSLATLLTKTSNPRLLIIVSIVALELAIFVGWRLIRVSGKRGDTERKETEAGTGGSIITGLMRVFKSNYLLGICGFVVLGKFAATFIYNLLQMQLSREMPIAEDRAELFSEINLYVQIGSFLLQGVVAAAMIRRLGVGLTLMVPCLVYGILYASLAYSPTLMAMSWAHAIQQIVSYGILVPTQHVLFTVVSREDKYKAKGFIDILVFRGSDVAAANACDALTRWGASIVRISVGMLPVTAIWLGLGLWLGRAYQRRASEPKTTIAAGE
jgi:AAA family ATP:ADP antiporter